MEYLFSYGTLQDHQVQHYIFGRLLKGKTDSVLGFKKLENAVYGRYPLVVNTNDPEDKVAGIAYEVNETDLKKADIYETSAYKRQKFPLESGDEAWIYIENSN
ncbi:gamma-glutamylcyclotransferase [Muricauda oceani]|uniref:Gamma-glutamylcyclotransferase n=1 Tax=Flagellimonas oceani TaxID=2698672 RepID=A0A6G7J8C3_9FLAO|nr:gamma-glutamylcyclotransferase family protein [Allomuricauda oceani]MBW8242950.1 gamma-glutamylcyclotransferase [Allomuricauda oceani]QII46692.1 gamma-glutamylcyclotransferase [Allomuricauda oceani]